MTIGGKLAASRGIAPGFDFLRVALAICVVTFHSFWVIDETSPIALARASWFPIYSILPMFFALSGFLIAGSAQRLGLKDFMINRGLRIVPALAVEIVASAFVLGALFTTLPLHNYLSNWETLKYFTNIFGKVNFHLPGVFMNLPSKGIVNSSLWTIPWEYLCYAIMAALITTGLIRKHATFGWLVAGFIAAGVAVQALGMGNGPSLHAKILGAAFYGEGARLLVFFVAGILAYQMRDKIRYSRLNLAAAIAACVAIAVFTPLNWNFTPAVSALTVIPLTYLTVFIGVSTISRLPVFHRGDYSYGIYLYGFPIQQAIQSMFHLANPWLLTLCAIPAITLFAMFSWHFIEKPTLKLRKKFSFVARVRLTSEELTATPSSAPPPPPLAAVRRMEGPAAG